MAYWSAYRDINLVCLGSIPGGLGLRLRWGPRDIRAQLGAITCHHLDIETFESKPLRDVTTFWGKLGLFFLP